MRSLTAAGSLSCWAATLALATLSIGLCSSDVLPSADAAHHGAERTTGISNTVIPTSSSHPTSNVTRRAPTILILDNAGKARLLGNLFDALGCDPCNHTFESAPWRLQCTTCRRDRLALVNLCGMPGYQDSTMFRPQFEFAIDAVTKATGPIAKIVHVVDMFNKNCADDADLRASVNQARRLNLLLTEAGHDDALELVSTVTSACGNAPGEHSAPARLEKIQCFNDDPAGVADPIPHLSRRITTVEANNYTTLTGKVKAWATVPATKPIETNVTLEGAIRTCRARVAALQIDVQAVDARIAATSTHCARPALLACRWSGMAYNLTQHDQGEFVTFFDQGSIVVAFPGSHVDASAAALHDWIAKNMRIAFVPYEKARFPGVLVHAGFFGTFQTLRPMVQERLERLLGEHPHAPVVFTGHSRGGALATLAAFEFNALVRHQGPRNVSLYTFGSPMVGNHRFAEEFNKLPIAQRLTVFDMDPVPDLPGNFLLQLSSHTGSLLKVVAVKSLATRAVSRAIASTTVTVVTKKTILGYSFGGLLGTTTTTVAAPISSMVFPVAIGVGTSAVAAYLTAQCAREAICVIRNSYQHTTVHTRHKTEKAPWLNWLMNMITYHTMHEYMDAAEQRVSELDEAISELRELRQHMTRDIARRRARCDALDHVFNHV
ncbi:Fungal lipase-like domain-containing protein [Plasmodiophora brassicae]|uniref:Fungal lipase-type domain-containing protein n=1 Tax=Plasmodiophora brassicae TaxID=37360 RepID=A0A0G4IHI7_PLABS|nr:hypothetical protein PBRA_000429 [Plasmodiophora brassicae]SPQ93093.1 unnamed protein product [Plasmodiophora brassicae]